MRNTRTILAIIAIVTTQQIFADNVSGMPADSSGDKSCSTIANACLAAGFVKTESTTKAIWHDCMKPLILGQTVSGVTVDSSVAKSCRVHKIKELKNGIKRISSS